MPTTLLIVYRVLGTVLFVLAAAAIVEKYRTVRGATLLPARVLECLCPDGGACARIGGDEFVLLAPGLGWQGAEELAGQICRRMPLLTEALEFQVPVGISVGVHVFECAGAHLDAIYQEADVALYAAKRERGRWVATRGLNVEPSV